MLRNPTTSCPSEFLGHFQCEGREMLNETPSNAKLFSQSARAPRIIVYVPRFKLTLFHGSIVRAFDMTPFEMV